MVKKRRTNLSIRRYKIIAFVVATFIAIISGFVASSINQPTIRVNAESSTTPVIPANE